MTTPTIRTTNASSPVLNAPMGLAKGAFSPQEVPVFDFQQDIDCLPVTGVEEEFDFDDYVAQQDVETQQAINDAGSWVADTFYAGEHTLATLRLRAKLSQRALADKCGLKQPHLCRYEKGSVEPGLRLAATMASALGVTLDEFAMAFQNSAKAR